MAKNTIFTPEVRLSYPYIFTPRIETDDQGNKKGESYETVLVFPAGTDVTPYQQALLDAAVEKWGEEKTAQMLKTGKLKLPIRSNPDLIEEQGYGDAAFYFNAKNKSRPGVVSEYPDPEDEEKPAKVTDPDLIYPGVVCKAAIRAYAWEHPQGGKGCSFSLEALQRIRDGERFDGRVKAEDIFAVNPNALKTLDQAIESGGDEDSSGEGEEAASSPAADAAMLAMLGGS